MPDEPSLAVTAALIGGPARANILCALGDGRALTANELAYVAGVTARTASGHLAKLLEGGLVAVERQGRHRYFRLGGAEVGRAIEALLAVSPGRTQRLRRTGPRDAKMRFARTCYGHLAGRLGVALCRGLLDLGYIVESGDDFDVRPPGRDALLCFGIDVDALGKGRRVFAGRCLDWSERRPHLGGALGAGILERCQQLGWLRRAAGTRTVILTRKGRKGLAETFASDLDRGIAQ